MIKESIFSKIVNKKIPADIVYQDTLVTAFRDIKPKAPIHILIVPNKIIETINDISDRDESMLGHLFTVAVIIARQEKISQNGYRLIMNCNQDAGQEVYHIHMHLLGGKQLGPLII